MAVKKYFIDNVTYGANDLNKICNSLRTDGVYGELANCLYVSKNSNNTVKISPGIGWVEGCAIEVIDNEYIDVPTSDGIYSIVLNLYKDNNVIDDIKIECVSGEVTGKNVLARVKVQNGVILEVADLRQNSTFKGGTQAPIAFSCGSFPNIYEPLSVSGVVTKRLQLPLVKNRAKLIFTNEDENMHIVLSNGLKFIEGGKVIKDGDEYIYRGSTNKTPFGKFAGLKSINLQGSELTVVFFTTFSDIYSPNVNTTIYWEVC